MSYTYNTLFDQITDIDKENKDWNYDLKMLQYK